MLKNVRQNLISRLREDEKVTTIGFSVIGLILAFLLVNIFYLNLTSFQKTQTLPTTTIGQLPTTQPTNIPSPTQLITPTTSQVTENRVQTVQAKIKDYFIPLGSGTTQGQDWVDIPGAQASLDFTQYSPIKEIRFEASVNVPTGNEAVSIRLYNVTDKHPVWYSEINSKSNTTSYLSSSPIVYDFGTKLYQVQIKTELQYPANVTMARIHVISQ